VRSLELFNDRIKPEIKSLNNSKERPDNEHELKDIDKIPSKKPL
jgi:hypothetical protein